MTGPSVALVDDHELLVQTVTLALAESGIDCVGVPPRPPDALLAALADLHPDLVLLDLDLGPFGDATTLIGDLADQGLRVLVLTAQTDRIRHALAMEQGAIGIQPKAAGFDDLIRSVRGATETTAAVLDPADASALACELAAHRTQAAAEMRPFQSLTERECQTLSELADGRTVQQIAARWVVSQATVRTHVQSILTKLGATSQLQAVMKAVRAGWLPRESRDQAS